MFKKDYKLIYYRYEQEKDVPQPYQDGAFELYNLKEDPEELINLIGKNLSVEKNMRDEFLSVYNIASQPL
jgi:arylsulfatase A-like enzyme